MPRTEQSIQITNRYSDSLRSLVNPVLALAHTLWRGLSWTDLEGTYAPIQRAMDDAIRRAQVDAVRLTAGYLGAFLTSELGERTPTPVIDNSPYVGRNFTGRDLTASLRSPLIEVLIANSAKQPDPLGTGLKTLLANIDIDIKQAARDALQDFLEADDRFDGWRRATRGTCSVCFGLADESLLPPGTPLDIHPGCQCVAEPNVRHVQQLVKREGREKAFQKMTREEQNQYFGDDIAEGLRNGTIKFSQLVKREGRFIVKATAKELGVEGAATEATVEAAPVQSALESFVRIPRKAPYGSMTKKSYSDMDDVIGLPKDITPAQVVIKHGSMDYRNWGQFSYGWFNKPPEIRVGKLWMLARREQQMSTLWHEFGHYLDAYLSPGSRGTMIATNLTDAWRRGSLLDALGGNRAAAEAFRDIMDRITASNAVSALRSMYDHDRWGRYVLNDHELFARSFAQYIATRGGEKLGISSDMAAVQRFLEGKALEGKQWARADFSPIARAFDKFFEAMGMRR